MALTLIEAAKAMTGDVLRQTVVELFAQQTDLLRVLPFDDIPGSAYKYNQEDTLPGIAFRGIGEGYPESTGVINPQVESLVIVGGDLDVDKAIVKMMGADRRAQQENMKLKSLSHNYSNNFIKGDSFTVAKSFDGIQQRLVGAQVVSNDPSADGGALSLLKLDEVNDAVDNPTHWLMTKKHRRLLTAASRNTAVGGFITWELNEFGKRVALYMGLPILIADGNADLFATLDDSEAYSGGGAADGSSIYCLSLGVGMLYGIQNGPPEVTDLGELDAKPTFRTRVEWLTALAMEHPRAAARLRDIDAALPVIA